MVLGHQENIFIRSGLEDLYKQLICCDPNYGLMVSLREFERGFHFNEGYFPGDIRVKTIAEGTDSGKITLEKKVQGEFKPLPIIPVVLSGQGHGETVGQAALRVSNQGYID